MSLSSKIRTVFRGDISVFDLPREVLRRKRAAERRKIERRDLELINSTPARLSLQFASLKSEELLEHFGDRPRSFFSDGINLISGPGIPHEESARVIAAASRIVYEKRWELAGFGALEFGGEDVWRKDPISGKDWGLDYHEDVVVYENDGADIRILWELNRLGHVITLALAYELTKDEEFVETFFSHVESWMEQNPYGRGANWNCAMEAALRAINLLAAFDIFRRAKVCTAERLANILRLFDQHGRFILDNNEFSYIATSNHYLSDVVGLFWIGTFLPELERAAEWRELGFSEMVREIDKQVLPDGADFEASTGYHKFVTELMLFSFHLADVNGIEFPEKYKATLLRMLEYINGIMRPDGLVPLIGDADGSQIIPMVTRLAADQGYLLDLSSIMLKDPVVKNSGSMAPEVFWMLGNTGASGFAAGVTFSESLSRAFPDAGAYVMTDGDLYMHFNANDCGVNGRGSHAHNDALSIELAAFGREFIVDPGSYVYNLDREARHMFRSTAYHSTVKVDGMEQNTMSVDLPFIIGNEAAPALVEWVTSPERDLVSAEHSGYMRLPAPVRHRRTVKFNKTEKYWVIVDDLTGEGTHDLSFAFHLSPGIAVDLSDALTATIGDGSGRELLIRATGIDVQSQVVPAFVSRGYGHREPSSILKWELTAKTPITVQFIIVPTDASENKETRLELLSRLSDNMAN